MKTKNFVEDLKKKSVDELNAQLVEAKKELFNLLCWRTIFFLKTICVLLQRFKY